MREGSATLGRRAVWMCLRYPLGGAAFQNRFGIFVEDDGAEVSGAVESLAFGSSGGEEGEASIEDIVVVPCVLAASG